MNDQLYQLILVWGSITVIAPWIAIFAILALLASSAGLLGGAGGSGTITTTGPVPLPPPTPAPPKPRFTNIVATSFAGQGDVENSAYTGRVIDGDKLGCALPYLFSAPVPTLSVFYNGKTVSGVPLVDRGPWNLNDPYWDGSGRPEAESGTDNTGRRTNLAGIDLTPGTWQALGYQGDASAVKDKVTWDFDSYLAGTTATPATPPAGTPAWVTLGRTFDGLVWSSGPMPAQLQTWMDHISAVFPEMAPYCKSLRAAGASNWFAWCGFFVQAMLSYSNIRGPISAAGLTGETTTSDWAYVDAWLTWGTKVWGPEDGDVSNANPQPGDVLIWNAPGIHHVSFYDHLEPDTNNFASLGGDQGKPLRVCIEDISMSYCVAIRRPPQA